MTHKWSLMRACNCAELEHSPERRRIGERLAQPLSKIG